MTRTTRVLVAVATLVSARAAHADTITAATGGEVQFQFVYSKAGFSDALVLAPSAGVTVAGSPGVTNCAFHQVTAGTPNTGCLFDEGLCANPPNTDPATVCPQVSADYNCSCKSQSAFVTIGTVADATPLNFQLLIDTDRDTITDLTLPSIGVAGDGFNHMRATPLGVDLWLMEWEDGISGGDMDFNDFVAVVRIVPVSCATTPTPAYCLSSSYFGGETLGITHVQSDDPSTTAGAGIQLQTVFLNNDTVNAHNVAVCQKLQLDWLSGTDEPAQQPQFFANLATSPAHSTSGKPACSGFQLSGPPIISFSLQQQSTPLTSPGNPNFDSATGACRNITYSAAPEDTFPLALATPDLPVATYRTYPGPGTKVVYGADFDPVVQTVNRVGTTKTLVDIENAVKSTVNGLSLTSYVYDLHATDYAAGFSEFYCPSGTDVFLSPTVNDGVTPVKVQSVPATLAINSPVTVHIQTVPMGTDDPAAAPVKSFLILSYNDNLPELDPTRDHLSSLLETFVETPGGDVALNVNEPFYTGGSGIRLVKVRTDFPSGLPEGFRARLVAVLRNADTGENLIFSTIPMSYDHTAPTLSTAATVRDDSSVTATALLTDIESGLGPVMLTESKNSASAGRIAMSGSNGNFYDATLFQGVATPVIGSDVVTLDLDAQDSHANAIATVRLPVASTGGSRPVECTSPSGAHLTLDGSGATGTPPLTITWSGPFGSATGVTASESLAFGPATISQTVTDSRGFTGTQTSTLTVGDTTPPVLTTDANPSCVWPPNHKLAPFTLGSQIQYTVADTCDAHPTVSIVNVTASNGSAVGFDATHFCARADKDTTYTVTVKATDSHGNASTKTTTVVVPHSHVDGCESPSADDGDPVCCFP